MEIITIRPELNLCKRLGVLLLVAIAVLIGADARSKAGNAHKSTAETGLVTR